jgi:hypothetical protein
MTIKTDKPTLEWFTDRALMKQARMIAYVPKAADGRRKGWYMREYHSSYALEQYLKGEEKWGGCAELGPFRTEAEAREGW